MNLQKVNYSFQPGHPHGIIFPSHSTGTVYEQYPLRRAPSESPSLQEESRDVETVSQGNPSQELTENAAESQEQAGAVCRSKPEVNVTDLPSSSSSSLQHSSKNSDADFVNNPDNKTLKYPIFFSFNGPSDTSGDEPTAESSESLNADHGETTAATQPFSESSSDQFPPENQAMAAAANASATGDQLQEDDTPICAVNPLNIEVASAFELPPYIELPSSTHGIQIAQAVIKIPTSDGYVHESEKC